jgi:hypothetical protein
MRLMKVHVKKYRSVRDSDEFNVERTKTIFVGPNEAGKTAILQALQQVSPPEGIRRFDALRDYPRSEYNDITRKHVLPQNITVVVAHFALEEADKNAIPEEFRAATYVVGRKLDNSAWHDLIGGSERTTFGSIKRALGRLAAHADVKVPPPAEGQPVATLPSIELDTVTKGWPDTRFIRAEYATALSTWLKKVCKRPNLTVLTRSKVC